MSASLTLRVGVAAGCPRAAISRHPRSRRTNASALPGCSIVVGATVASSGRDDRDHPESDDRTLDPVHNVLRRDKAVLGSVVRLLLKQSPSKPFDAFLKRLRIFERFWLQSASALTIIPSGLA
jgi:hypothetical protein